MDLMTNTQMDGKTPLEQAKKAILHTLQTIAGSKERWELLGLGTQSFSLLTEAAATLFGEPLGEVRERFCDAEEWRRK